MATYGGQDYTSFRAVNVRGSTNFRMESGAAAGTIKVDLSEGLDRAYTFPNKSGTFPIMGSFAIQLPALGVGTSVQSTIATVAGIRAEDALVVMVNGGVSAGYGALTGAGATQRIIYQALPGNGNITVSFLNYGAATGTGYVELVCSYLAVR